MAKKPMSQVQANAYKTQAEGKALIINALMPLLKIVAYGIFALLAIAIGVDLTSLVPVFGSLEHLKP